MTHYGVAEEEELEPTFANFLAIPKITAWSGCRCNICNMITPDGLCISTHKMVTFSAWCNFFKGKLHHTF